MPKMTRRVPDKIKDRPKFSHIKKETLFRLLDYIGRFKVQLTIVVIAIIISAVANASIAVFLKILIDNHIAPLLLESNPQFDGLRRVIGAMATLFGVGIFSGFLYNRIMAIVSQGVLKQIRDEVFTALQRLPIKYFDSHSHGDIMSHFTNDIDTLRQMISQSLPQVFSSTITVIAVLMAMLFLSVWLTLFVLVFVVIVLFVVRKIASRSGTFFVKQQRALGDVNGYVEEMIHGQKVVKVFTYEARSKAVFNEKNEQLAHFATQANTYANILMPIMNSLGYIQYVLLALVGGTLSVYGLTNISLMGVSPLTLGVIASFLQLSRNFIQPIAQVSQQLNSVILALAGAERIFELLDQEPEFDDGFVSLVNVQEVNGELVICEECTQKWAWKHPRPDGTFTLIPLAGDVRFFDVDFSYDDINLVLKDITLYAKPGQKVALVGATGAGKTTITNLINRFYDIADGKIQYDTININNIKKSDLRRSLGMVLQDVHLFTGSVMDNIRYGNLNATDEQCIEAAKLANAHGFISMLPQGYDTIISGSIDGLSQGQRQLISIARAAVANPPVMILDEATSSIDTRTEAIVQQGMDQLMDGRTVFVIAHRLSTVKNANVIMVIDQGRIIERGDHDQLLAEQGHYYKLYTGEFELS
ncbi:MAG: ABC transporter ATP-binding protein [Erysipelothrix sp.]|nr:ABC transporter ATP-binding protein [Erysipelothrix sp.]